MRTSRLPAAAAADAHRLADLKTESQFLIYDALFNACDAAEAALAVAAALAAPVPSKEHAEMRNFYVDGRENTNENGWGQQERIRIPKGQVLYIQHVLPLPVNNDEQWLLRATTFGPSGPKTTIIAQYLIKNIGGLKEFLQRDMRLALDGGESEELVLDANGCEWAVQAWLGHPSKIPGLA